MAIEAVNLARVKWLSKSMPLRFNPCCGLMTVTPGLGLCTGWAGLHEPSSLFFSPLRCDASAQYNLLIYRSQRQV